MVLAFRYFSNKKRGRLPPIVGCSIQVQVLFLPLQYVLIAVEEIPHIFKQQFITKILSPFLKAHFH
jgi:hypothetical protein